MRAGRPGGRTDRAKKKTVAPKPATPKPPARAARSGPEEVQALMASLKHPRKAEIEAVRRIILGASRRLEERVKWKAPSFHCGGVDLGAFNLHQVGFAQLILVFPRGIPEETGSGLLEGAWKDRREVRFHDLAEVDRKKAGLVRVVRAWVGLLD